MNIETGLANYVTMVTEKWTTDDTKLNIGSQIVEHVKLNTKDIHIPELRIVFVGEDKTSDKDKVSSTLMVFPDSNAVLLVILRIKDKDQMKAIAEIIIDKMNEEKWDE